jgi:DnaJ-domain-containing protein 1
MRRAKRQNAQTNRSDASVEFRDLERHRWHFFLRSSAAANGANDATLPEGFGNALNAAGAWLGWQGTLLRHDRRPTPADYSQRLVVEQATEWREHGGILRTLEARTLLDACYLQLGAAIEGALDPDCPRALQDAFPALDAGEQLLGVAECWCLMLAAGDLDEPALQDALERLALPPDGYLTFDTQGGRLALYPNTLTACIVYAPAQTQPMSVLLHQLLPPFLLNLLKIRLLREREQYPQFKQQVQGEEEQLERLMAQARQAHQLSIEQIEQHSVQLAQQQAHYLEALSKIEEWLHTLKTLQDNLRRLLRDPLWLDGEASEPARRLLEPVQRLIDQMRSDLHYFHITRQQADLHLESLNTASVTRNTQWNRGIAIVLLLLAFPTLLGAVAEFFPEITKWPVLLRVVVAGVLCLVVGVLLARLFNPSRYPWEATREHRRTRRQSRYAPN